MSTILPVISNMTQIIENFSGVLLDAYGVFWDGNETGTLPGSKEAMEKLVLNGKIVGVLSNSTQLAAKEIHKLRSYGILQGKHFHFLITSGEVARTIFLYEKLPFHTIKNKFWVFGGLHPKYSSYQVLFQGTSYTETQDINEADFIYISIPHIEGQDQTDPEVFHQEIQQIRKRNLPMICSHPDQFAHEGKPSRPVVRQGSIAAMYEKMGGQVFYIGKPYPQAFSSAMENFHQQNIFNPQEILMVGDTPETDIRGARNFGMATALITQTGIMANRIFYHGLEKAIKNLTKPDYPDFFITRLAHDVSSSS